MNTRRRFCVSMGILAAAGPAMFASARAAATWKAERPVRFIVPFAAGGASDAFARLISEPVTRGLAQTLVVENKPGAGGVLAADFISKAAPDGYSLLMATPGTQLINPYLFKSIPYDPDQFVPVGPLFDAPNVLVVHPSVPARTVAELIALAKSQPGKLNFSSSGPGSSSHLSGEMFNLMAGVQMTHVPYKGSGPAMTDLLAGRVQLTIDTISTVLPHIRSGGLRALGIGTLAPHPALPDVPTIAATVPGFESGAINYVLAPPRTPPEVVATLSQAFRKALQEPATKSRVQEQGYTILLDTPEQLGQRIQREQAKWKDVIVKAGVTV
ncbi:Bug family tripartite tricarboxylate transporter substrate binding protein [Bordetella genomosp. 13]|uniref:Bug family tripartite tricarboxylate transporter substrate binding protein n=1 Tax=Bordetella genomosp. 13 TaxID=463040 RepID=UPI0011A29BB9|nr:tripartite tricarboxylate transporter substrate binding protein [Bordetella genomosp. 13]